MLDLCRIHFEKWRGTLKNIKSNISESLMMFLPLFGYLPTTKAKFGCCVVSQDQAFPVRASVPITNGNQLVLTGCSEKYVFKLNISVRPSKREYFGMKENVFIYHFLQFTMKSIEFFMILLKFSRFRITTGHCWN